MATQIKSFGKSRMTIGSCSEFHNNALDLITKTTPAELHIEALEPAYSQAVGQLAGIVNRQRAYISTAQLADTDKVRDNAVGTISSVVIAYQTTPVEDKRQAAMLLDPQLAAYKGIRKHEYSKETAEIKGMLGVLQAEDNQAAVTLLGLDAEVTALAEANAAFEAAFLGKAQARLGAGGGPGERALRPDCADGECLCHRAAHGRAAGLHQRPERHRGHLCRHRGRHDFGRFDPGRHRPRTHARTGTRRRG